jgi:beta-xylosidase
MKWVNDWPVIGVDMDGDGKGEPVMSYRRPDVGREYPLQTPQTTDEFENSRLSLQWQWHANPVAQWSSFTARRGWLRLTAVPWPENGKNLWAVPSLLLQKLPTREFTVTTFVDASHLRDGERSGLLMMGRDYSYLAVARSANGLRIVRVVCLDAPKGGDEKETGTVDLKNKPVYLRVSVSDGALCQFSYSFDGQKFERLGDTFNAQSGLWIGAKVGLFSIGPSGAIASGYADYDWFRLGPRITRTEKND